MARSGDRPHSLRSHVPWCCAAPPAWWPLGAVFLVEVGWGGVLADSWKLLTQMVQRSPIIERPSNHALAIAPYQSATASAIARNSVIGNRTSPCGATGEG